jgi:carboxypeptidase Taq
MATQNIDGVYEDFLETVERYHHLESGMYILTWDQRVTMPSGGTPARSKQRSALSTQMQGLLSSKELGEQIDTLEGNVDGDRAAIVREMRRQHDRAANVPESLVERLYETRTDAMPVWRQAREDADFSQFEDTLAELVDIRQEFAAAIDPDRDPYAVLVEKFEPYIDIDRIEAILDTLSEELPDLIEAVANSDVELTDPFDGTYDEAQQEALARETLDILGYDWDRGRLDISTHPFSIGTPYDARIATRFPPEDPLDAIGSTTHEFGHANYTLGLPDDAYGTPLGDYRDMTVHESQSRLWENHVGRSLPFWRHLAPTVRDHLDVDASPRELYEGANQVYDANMIRVEADELTYHAHILLRFEIERDLIRGDLEVSEVPGVWNDKMEEYLGIRPDSDAEGCLQDVHWADGSFGYFPTYSLGSMLAAQLYDAVEDDLGSLDDRIEAGNFEELNDWLRETIHRHGCRYTTPELVERATGEQLSADSFLTYAQEKYGALYDL